MDQTEEKTFIRKLKKMDKWAWEALCREYSAPLLAFVQYRFGCDREKAGEIVQMTFVRCVKSIRNFKPSRGTLLNWLKTISKNEMHTLLQQEQKQLAAKTSNLSSVETIEGILEKMDTAALPEEIIAKGEFQLLVHETIAELYSRYRKVLILKYVENRKVAEIASMLGQSEKAIESLLSRSRQAFKKVFLQKAGRAKFEEGGLLK
ncbi:MAG: sigma-70 family RNA polymerase sigma factor [Sedimentisphaerales bacterium]|nr:sigma-70 family RNA polymerase sigma factor [Sedimentisphaerales bacterium]